MSLTGPNLGIPDLAHHGDAELAPGLLDLAVNVRPDPLPDWLAGAIAEACTELATYPDSSVATEAVARFHGRDAAEVLITAGAAEAFTLIAQGLPRGRAVVIHPQFTEPEAALRAARWPVERVICDADFALDPSAVPDATTLVSVGNPTNPTGVLHPRDAILALRRPGRTVLVDEAFMDVVPGEPESITGLADLTGLVITRSLTKTWGLAGLRIGYAVGDPAVIAAMAAVQPHWSVSSPALAALIACLSPAAGAEVERRTAVIEHDRAFLQREFAQRGFDLTPASVGPFLLTRHPDRPNLHAELRAAGIAVRRADTFPGLGPGWIRIAVRDRASLTQLIGTVDGLAGNTHT
jgi:histidinol-phosphate aminotransferase